MGYILRFAYSFTHNYLFSIFLLTIVFELLLSPLAVKQQKNQIKQALLAPKVSAIRKKYAGRTDQATQQKIQQEIMDMYKKENFNPAGGCGTLIIQFPIIICLYNVVVRPLRYICNVPTSEITALQSFFESSGATIDARNIQIDIINRIRENVSDYFSIAPSLKNAVIPNFTVGPFDLSQTPQVSFSPFNWLMLIPVITFFVMILSQKIMQRYTYQSPETADAQNGLSMKIMMWSLPLVSVFFEFQIAAAIGVYWVFRSVLQTVEKIIIAKIYPLPKLTEADFKEAEKAAGSAGSSNKKKKDPNKPPVRSLHHIDDEEYLARHKNDFAAVGDGDTEQQAIEAPVAAGDNNSDIKAEISPAGKLTKGKNAPAPIKNDEKGTYKNK